MGVKISETKRYTVVAEQDLFVVPGNYIAYLKRLEITNEGTALATVTFKAYNGDSSKTILTKSVAAGETISLSKDDLPVEGIPTKITVSSTSQPYSVDYSIILE
jgi:hypothetical protein